MVLAVVALLTASCGLESQTPEERWQETYNKGFVEYSEKRLDQAEKTFESALLMARRIDPKGKRVADTVLPLGEIALKKKQLERAITYLTDAKAIYETLWDEKLGGVNNRDNAIYLSKIMLAYSKALFGQEKVREANEAIKRARHIAEVAPAPDYVTHDIMVFQSKIIKKLGLKDESQELSEGASVFDTPADGKNSEHTRNMSFEQLLDAGDDAVAAFNFESANAMYATAKSLLEKNNQGGIPLGRLYLSMGNLYDTQREYEKAEKTLSKALRILQVNERMPTGKKRRHYYTGEAVEKLAAVYLHTGRLHEAQVSYESALKIERQLNNSDKFVRRERKLMEALVEVFKKQGKYAEAENLMQKKLAMERPLYGSVSQKLADGYRELGYICALAGKNEEAARYFEEALKGYDRVRDLNPKEKLLVYDAYADLCEKTGRNDKALELRKLAEDLEGAIVKELHD